MVHGCDEHRVKQKKFFRISKKSEVFLRFIIVIKKKKEMQKVITIILRFLKS